MGIETFPVLSLIVLSPFVGAILLLIEPQRWYYAIRLTSLSLPFYPYWGVSMCLLTMILHWEVFSLLNAIP